MPYQFPPTACRIWRIVSLEQRASKAYFLYGYIYIVQTVVLSKIVVAFCKEFWRSRGRVLVFDLYDIDSATKFRLVCVTFIIRITMAIDRFRCTTSGGDDLCFNGGICVENVTLNLQTCDCPEGWGPDLLVFHQSNVSHAYINSHPTKAKAETDHLRTVYSPFKNTFGRIHLVRSHCHYLFGLTLSRLLYGER